MLLRKKSVVAATFCAFAMVGVSATTASAGEVNGRGEPIPAPDQANSICAFSGLNDDPAEGGRVQSYGQLVRQGLIEPRFFNPGDACRGGSNFERD